MVQRGLPMLGSSVPDGGAARQDVLRPRIQPKRWQRSHVSAPGALSVSLAMASVLPRECGAALSVSSGYESFLINIRRRIVVEEDDVVDEAKRRGRAQPCDSMRDGPFCRGLPRADFARHRPFTVDSIVPQNLFGDRVKNEADIAQEGSAAKHAAAVLNHFLEDYYNSKVQPPLPDTVEGRLDFSRLPPWRFGDCLSPGFSRGLPVGVQAKWEGAWQAVLSTSPPSLQEAPVKRRPATVVRLNGALGTIRFSRPVIVRRLVLRPPVDAVPGRHRLSVKARKRSKEVWRTSYDYDSELGPRLHNPCTVGDLVTGRWTGDGRNYMAVILALHNSSATVRWLDEDHSHRLVPWRHLTTPDGVPCRPSRDPKNPTIWRDMARRSKTLDEINFGVPFGSDGWLLAELVVAAVRWRELPSPEEELKPEEQDPMANMVLVFPGRRAVIAEVSRVAVLYTADDMLEQGLRLRPGPQRRSEDAALGLEVENSGTRKDTDSPTEMQLSTSRSVEGLRQLLTALAGRNGQALFQLPPHMRREQVIADIARLGQALDPSLSEDRVVKKFAHFEAFFAFHWDWLTPVDALEVAYERWRNNPVAQGEATGAFFKGQVWSGSYFCTQGPTSLTIEVTSVEFNGGQETIQAELSFVIETRNKKATKGSYTVVGAVEPEGRAVALDPVPGSWKDRPDNFVMVGLQGVVSRVHGQLLFAGSVPIFGCDSFELKATDASGEAKDASEDFAHADALVSGNGLAEVPKTASFQAWSSVLSRLRRVIEDDRGRWRRDLQRLITKKGDASEGDGIKIGNNKGLASQVEQLMMVARKAGLMSFEMTTPNGKSVMVHLQNAER
mmetsp:Transcript_56686/g.112720  ORF Transcript_56686/g.112720 Transcript_56686/m.112720 type:complete len:838 (+) Transcript_56686:41-2554(+)